MTGPRPSGGQRIETIQVLRGLAALLVVWVHATNVVQYRPDMGAYGEWLSLPGVNDLGAIGVDVFFVISGFAMGSAVMADPQRGAARFLAERFVRIVPLFWLLSVAAGLVLWAIGSPIEWMAVVNTLTMLPIVFQETYEHPVLAVGWTLAFEWMFYCMLAACLLVARRHALAACCLAALASAAIAFRGEQLLPLDNLMFNALFAEFAAGLLLAWIFRSGWLTRSGVTGPVLLIGALAGVGWAVWNGIGDVAKSELMFVGTTDRARLIWWGLPAMAFTAGALAMGERWLDRRGGRGPGWRFARLIGDSSYSLYLVHWPLTMAAEKWLPATSLHGEWTIAILTVVSLALGLATYRFLEQPLLSLSRRAVFGPVWPRAAAVPA
ncbi:acyltransferase family protein [Tsuneonella dongtanensis]|nr:acyltransferase [Tsuneonella dongtanensis]